MKRMHAIYLVGNDHLGIYPFNELMSLSDISTGGLCDNASDRHTIQILGQINFEVAPLVCPMLSLPPRAPAACG